MNRLQRYAVWGGLMTVALSTPAPAQDVNSSSPETAPLPETTPSATPAPETTPEPPRKRKARPSFGVNTGLYVPSDAKTRSRFGSSGFSIGPGFGAIRRIGDKGAVGLTFSFNSQEQGANKFYLVPVGLNYIAPLGRRRGPSTRPFYGVSLEAAVAKIRSVPDNVDTGIKLGSGGSVFIGSTLGRKAFVEGRYRYVSEIAGFDLSGFEVSTGYRF